MTSRPVQGQEPGVLVERQQPLCLLGRSGMLTLFGAGLSSKGTGTPTVLTSKMRVPAPVGLRRDRLTALLHRLEAPTGLVIAAAGSGKTTLLSHTVASSPAPAAWYRATVDDDTVGALVLHLASALQLDLTMGRGSSAPALDSLLAGVDRDATRRLLVIDDVHEVHGSPAEQALERFVLLRPPTLRVVIGSRRDPSFNLTRLRLTGSVSLVRDDDLRFRSWEVEQLFHDVFGEPLSPEAAAALTRKTGGWAAGLQMFHLTTAGQDAGERQMSVERLDARSRLLRSYLAQNVLDALAPERRDFLTRTCALGLLTGELCDALLDRTQSAAELASLEAERVFTASDDDGRTYRYHQVLQSHLESVLLERVGPAGTRDWYSRCARLLEPEHPVDALRAYARAEDWASVGRLMQRAGPDLSVTIGEECERLLPAALRHQDPWLALAQARREVRAGRLAAAVGTLRRAESLFTEPVARDQCRRERLRVAAWGPPPGSGVDLARSPAGPSEAHWTERVRDATVHGTRRARRRRRRPGRGRTARSRPGRTRVGPGAEGAPPACGGSPSARAHRRAEGCRCLG